MPTVYGVFSGDDIEDAVDALGKHGYADNYRVIDRYNLRAATVMGVPGQGTGSGSSAALGGIPVAGAQIPDDTSPDVHTVPDSLRNVSEGTVEQAASEIRELGRMDRDESEYYAGRIFNGGSLIAVEVDSDDQVADVQSLLEEYGAQGME